MILAYNIMKILSTKCPHFDPKTNFRPFLKSCSCHTKHSTAPILNMGTLYQLDYSFTKYKEKQQLRKKVTLLQSMDQQ